MVQLCYSAIRRIIIDIHTHLDAFVLNNNTVKTAAIQDNDMCPGVSPSTSELTSESFVEVVSGDKSTKLKTNTIHSQDYLKKMSEGIGGWGVYGKGKKKYFCDPLSWSGEGGKGLLRSLLTGHGTHYLVSSNSHPYLPALTCQLRAHPWHADDTCSYSLMPSLNHVGRQLHQGPMKLKIVGIIIKHRESKKTVFGYSYLCKNFQRL